MTRKKKKKHKIINLIKKLIIFLFSIILIIGVFFCVKGYKLYEETIDEKPISKTVEEIRNMDNFVCYSDLPQFYIDATISIEDHRFEDHCGIDLIAIGRATIADIRALSFVQGGSTITQQLAKNVFFTQEKRIERKVAEALLALKLELKYTKEEIFELYANTAYFGNGYYGVKNAAMGYFGKEVSKLSEYECAMLAGIPNAPSIYSDDIYGGSAVKRTDIVLYSMVKNGIITQETADTIRNQ